jgi:phage-related minor tail protein
LLIFKEGGRGMAANRIKGITIEIGGDTTKLQTALKGVNTEIRSTQSQLKDVEKLLKLDPGNTELLALTPRQIKRTE